MLCVSVCVRVKNKSERVKCVNVREMLVSEVSMCVNACVL